jgi:hypothetical protein
MRNMPTKEGMTNPWNHPFWSVTQSAWIETKDLKEGEILSLGDGSEISIESITHYDTEETTVYNFEVEGNHTYYVSEAGVLVHNQSPSYASAFEGIKDFFTVGPDRYKKDVAKKYNLSDPNQIDSAAFEAHFGRIDGVKFGRESGGIDLFDAIFGSHAPNPEKEKRADAENKRVSEETQIYQDYYNEGFTVGLAESFHSDIVTLLGFASGLYGSFKPKVVSPSKVTNNKAPVTNEIYKRPANATNSTQKQSVQGRPCIDCGAITNKQIADHKTPLVKEHYETGKLDKVKMKSPESIQPQCPTCSAKQGAEMSKYSKAMKKIIEQRLKNSP